MSDAVIKVIPDVRMQLGECPLWHPVEAMLYWIDIAECLVYRFDPVENTHCCWRMSSEPGCIAWCASGGLLVALRSGIVLLDTDSGAITSLADAPYDTTLLRFNDGRCDAAGRLWVGSIYEPRNQARGSLFCVERGIVRDTSKHVTVSNGLAFSPDYRTLYHADTTAHRIDAYEFDIVNGSLGNGRVFQQFSLNKFHDYGGRPDGATVDSEGAYWCALYEGGRIVRIAPDGELLRTIVLPLRCPTMVAFGGVDLRTLYVTSACRSRSDAELVQYPLSGCVLTLQVDVPGCPEPAYIR
jgi:sugar lactone lactonase YvrE